MKVELKAVLYTKDGEPGMKMDDFLSKNCLSVFFRLWWVIHKWKQTTFTLTITKATGKLL